MNDLTIAGGLYQERCKWPEWDRVFGSGGRAAAALVGHVGKITFSTYATARMGDTFGLLGDSSQVEVLSENTKREVAFDYVHCLSTPTIVPGRDFIERNEPLEVEADCVLRFGMLEGSASVTAKRCVYDPQSGFSPERFEENGSSAKHLAIVGNRAEILGLGESGDVDEAAGNLLRDGAEVVVIKLGLEGAIVVTRRRVTQIEPHYSCRAWLLGSGDIFAAMFAARWAVHEDEPERAAELASAAVARYSETMALPLPTVESLQGHGDRVQARRGLVYLAGPFFTVGQRWLIDEVREALYRLRMEVFSPLHQVGIGSAQDVARKDLEGLRDSDVVFAILDGLDSGTLFEVGYARALKKPIYVLAQQVTDGDLKMIEGTGCKVHRDLVTGLCHLVWGR